MKAVYYINLVFALVFLGMAIAKPFNSVEATYAFSATCGWLCTLLRTNHK